MFDTIGIVSQLDNAVSGGWPRVSKIPDSGGEFFGFETFDKNMGPYHELPDVQRRISIDISRKVSFSF